MSALATSRDTIGVALFGFGRMGRIRHGILSTMPRIHLLHIVDQYPEVVIRHLEEKGMDGSDLVVHSDETKKVLQDARVTAVFISVPTNFHSQLITDALNAGKHVFVEKPVAPTLAETKLCYELAERVDKKLFCSFNRRFDPSYAKVREAIVTKQLGHLQLVNMHIGDHPEPDMSVLNNLGNMIWDMGIHGIDTVNWATGERPAQVSVMTNATPAYKAANNYDTMAMILKYPSGLIAYIDSCRYAPYGYDTRLEVIGSKSAIIAENVRADNVIVRDERGDHTTSIDYSFPERHAEAFRNECIHFFDVLKGKCEMSVTKDDVIVTMTTLMAAEESLDTGKVVNLHF